MQRRQGDRGGRAPCPVFKKTPQKSGSPVLLLSSSCSEFSSLHPGFLPSVGSRARVKHGIVSLALNLFQYLFIADTMMDKMQKVCRVPASLLADPSPAPWQEAADVRVTALLHCPLPHRGR